MDSDESRPGSSASNTSSSSADSNENVENGSPTSSRKSRSKSMNSNSSSSSSSRNNSNEDGRRSALSVNDGDQKSVRSVSQDGGIRSRSASAESNQSYSSNDSNANEEDGNDKHQRRDSNVSSQNGRSVSRNQSISPVRRSSKSSRNSSVSSVASDDDEQLKPDDISDNEMDVSQWASKGQNGSQDGNENVAADTGNDSDQDKDGASNNVDQLKHQDALNMSHEDLSDVSDLESAAVSPSNESDKHQEEEADDQEDKSEAKKPIIMDLRQKLDERKNQLKSLDDKQKENDTNRANNKKSPSIVDELKDIMDKKHDEDALDFEAEDGECNDESSTAPNENRSEQGQAARGAAATDKKDSDGEIEEGEELEEGEVSDEDEKRPEETEPKPVCRFYTRGQCTWGMSCRFLHPGVTDKGNYTMFDMIRPVPVSHTGPFGPGGAAPAYHDYRSDRPPIHHQMHPSFGNNNAGAGPPHQRPPVGEPLVESAWERGLRTAKEMMRKANKRKEQDMDFEDKKMNLSASQDELEKDNYYIRERSPDVSPPPMPFPVSRPPIPIPGHHANMGGYSPPPKYGPGRVAPPPYEEDAYGRSIRYRELPPHRMPQYEDEMIGGKRRIRPTREVIVQRVEPPGRGDEWNDPWMRSKSPGRGGEKRQKRDRRSYSSNSSYSSSSSSQSGSSSNSSRSPSPTTRRRRYSSTNNSGHKSPVRGRHAKRSPSPPELHKRRHSPVVAQPAVSKELHFDPKKDLRNHSALTKRNNPNAILVARRSPPVSKKRQLTPTIAIEKRVARSPPNKRKRPSPPPPAPRKPISFSIAGNNLRKKKRSSSSGSGSSDSSASESGTSYSSSSSSSSHNGRNHNASRSRDKIVSERKSSSKKAEASKKRSPPPNDGKSADAGNSSSKSNSSSANSKKTTRREELLKQLRAVEDAIARKRSKLN